MDREIILKWKRSKLESKVAAWERRKKISAAEAEALAKSTRKDDDPDRISELPNSILHHILSFLDMKHVIHTAFLSKRWTTIFKSLPTLSLMQFSYECTRHGNDVYQDIHDLKFIDFVDKVLGLREAAAADVDADNNMIRSLCIACFDKKMDIMNHVNTWMDFAVRHNVQELDLKLALTEYLDGDELLPLPHHHPLNLFSCKLLTTLNLTATEPGLMMIPHDVVVELPKLKELSLFSLGFHGEKINKNFFSRCPLLETLIITRCILENDILNIVVSEDHQLKYLKIACLDTFYFNKIDKIGQPSFHTIISAPKLTSLLIRDAQNDAQIFNDYNVVLENMHSLVKARMVSYEVNSRNLINKFLNSISNVKSLTLSAVLLHSVGIHACLKNLLCPFRSLRVLKLLMNTSFERDQIRAIAYLLEKCPIVETLVLKMSPRAGVTMKQQHVHEWDTIVNDKECGKADQLSSSLQQLKFKFKLDHLKFIEIRDFRGYRNELEFLIFMLMHTPVLEKIIIFANKKNLPTLYKETYRAMLETSPRASSKNDFLFFQDFKYEPFVRYQ